MINSDVIARLTRDFHVAAVLLTRLPLPKLPVEAFSHGARAVWAYPLVGALLGLAVWFIAALGPYLTPWVASLLAMATLIAMTGAMHEDGLADCADGFWGGHDRANRLEIMHDSNLGTFGGLALGMTILLRWTCYTMLINSMPFLFVATSALSRGMMPLLMAYLPHAREDGLSHSVGKAKRINAAIAVLLGSLVALVVLGWTALIALVFALIAVIAVGFIAKRKVGGQTGDVLGASQQMAEIAALMVIVALSRP